ncbi:MAG: sugar porter family MFS transporter [Clostridiales bacterium]|nr:sugar porter family MFS transporter [Clostridiales bacterium]
MNQSQAKGFGARGWVLIAVLFLGFFSFQTFTNYPLNILADLYGGSTTVAGIMSAGTFTGIVIQLILSRFIGRIKSIKKVAAIFGIIAIICAWIESALPFYLTTVWYVVYFLVNLTITIYALFFLSIIAGQWFPRKKGTVMGISTIAYPFCNGVIGFFASSVFKGEEPAIFSSFLPFLIAATVGLLLFLFLVTDYPEQVGAYRDNDKSFTPEVAKQMMEQEMEDKRTTVWTTGHIFACRDFWCAAVTCGMILMCAVGAMTQTNTIIGYFPNLNYTIIMMVIAVFGAIGSWLLGMLDTALGTKKSMMICVILMVISGICGIAATATNTGALVVFSLILLAMFMGASSNYTVSVAVQYWRREDFAGVFACVNPIANIFNALAPTITAALLFAGGNVNVSSVFIMITIAGVIGILLMILFSGAHVKKVDDKYRAAAGKPLDDALVGRK